MNLLKINFLFRNDESRNIISNQKLAKFIATFLVASTFCSFSAFCASSTDDRFFDLVLDICRDNPADNPSNNLIELCREFISGSGAGGGGNSLSSTNANLGVLGAQGRVSNAAARGLQTAISERLEEIKEGDEEESKIGGGASSDVLYGNWGLFLSGQHTDTERKQTSLENGYDSNKYNLLLGVDYRFSEHVVVGIAAGYAHEDADFDNNAGNLDTESWNISTYSTLLPTENLYIDIYLSYAALDYQSKRNASLASLAGGDITGTPKSNTNGDQYLAGIGAGYTLAFGGFSIDPRLKLDYSFTQIDGYTEAGNSGLELQFSEQEISSLLMSAGVNFSYAQSLPFGVITPNARVFYHHEFQNDSRSILNSLAVHTPSTLVNITDNPDRDYIVWGVGISTIIPNGITIFADFEQLTSHSFLDSWTASGGLRLEF